MPTIVSTAQAPEPVVLSSAQHDLILYAVVVAGLALFAQAVYNAVSCSEVSSRYRPAIYASLCIAAVAALSYLGIYLNLHSGYSYDGGVYRPTPDALTTISPRYMDWSITVPLLTAELLAVCTLAGRRLSVLRATTMAAAFVMIGTGYLGAKVFEQGSSAFWLWLWWGISMVFFGYLYAALIPAVLRSIKELPGEVGRTLGWATVVLLGAFLVYPIVYLIPIFFSGGWWTATMHVAFSAADIVAKVAFGMLIHKVAKLRTAYDVTSGEDTHLEPVWINDVHHSDGVLPEQRGLVAPSR